MVEGIALSSREQALGIQEINNGLAQIDEVTQSNTAAAEQSASAAEELSAQTTSLREMIATFSLKGTHAEQPQTVAADGEFLIPEQETVEVVDGW